MDFLQGKLLKLLCFLFWIIWSNKVQINRFFFSLLRLKELKPTWRYFNDTSNNSIKINVLFFIYFWPHLTACGILVPQPGIERRPLAVKAWSPNHWTFREFPETNILNQVIIRLKVPMGPLFYLISKGWAYKIKREMWNKCYFIFLAWIFWYIIISLKF